MNIRINDMDLILKNGILVTSEEMYLADIGISGEKIAAIGTDLQDNTSKIIDVTGKYILPGAIDAHTHMAMPFGGTVSSDGYLSGTKAAACGGVTTIIDYAMQRSGKGIMETIEERKSIAQAEVCVDYGFHCIITDLNNDAILDEFESAVQAGITSFKCFFVYKKEKMMVDDGTFLKVLLEADKVGAIVNIHAENSDAIDLNIERLLRNGKTSAWYHYVSRTECVESEAVKRAVHWAVSFNKPLYIVHMADKEGIEAVTLAKDSGYRIYAETCPQYLEFTCDVYKREDGRNFVCSPPMKGKDSKIALWDALKRGDIDTIATDHCPFYKEQKDWGINDFTKIPNGCGGIEFLYPYILNAANAGVISFSKAVEVCSFNPAKIFGCHEKGSLSIGKDADIVVYDPDKDYTVSAKHMHSKCDHTIWEGKSFHGFPVLTFVRGKLVYDNGKFMGVPGFGKFIKRKAKKTQATSV